MGMVPPRILKPRVIEEAINREVLFKTQEVVDALAQAFGGMSLNEVRTRMDLPLDTRRYIDDGYGGLISTEGLMPIIRFGETEPIAYIDDVGHTWHVDEVRPPQYKDAAIAYEDC